MITYLSLAAQKRENTLIAEAIRYQAARRTDEEWNCWLFEQLKKLEEYLIQDPLLDIICWDITMPGAVESLERMRKNYRHAFLMVVADSKISPMVYLRPGIMPTALLLKPVKKESVVPVVEEMMELFSERFDKKEVPDSFVIDRREGKQYIPLQQIYYVEAREKKIYIRTKQEEYGFYDTIENMEEKLPDSFCRCHRSYIVNMARIRTVKASLNLIELQEGISVPLSRSYKKMIKEYYKND